METETAFYRGGIMESLLEPSPSGQSKNCKKTHFLFGVNLEAGLLLVSDPFQKTEFSKINGNGWSGTHPRGLKTHILHLNINVRNSKKVQNLDIFCWFESWNFHFQAIIIKLNSSLRKCRTAAPITPQSPCKVSSPFFPLWSHHSLFTLAL